MSGTTKSSTVPRAIVHKKILDAAEADPDASIEKLAKTVNGASADLVEQVLDEYGDPVKETPTVDEGNTALQQSPADSETEKGNSETLSVEEEEIATEKTATLEELTEKQEATLRVIHENPEATQRELAKRFGVSSATICKRVNNIDGFEWETREEFAAQLFDGDKTEETTEMTEHQATHDNSGQLDGQLDELQQRVQSIEEKLEGESQSHTAFDDPTLVHKVVHACMNSDQISEEEELRILEGALGK